MPFNIFLNENVAHGLPANAQYQAGISNIDPQGTPPENGITLPVLSDPSASYDYFENHLEYVLDSGVVTHRYLPQFNGVANPDTLSSYDVFASQPSTIDGGVNLVSNDDYEDIVQQMAHSRYWIHMYGQGVRIGRQIPIPGLVGTIGGVKATPDDERPQTAFNKIVGNYSGQVVFYARWSLWYTLTEPPNASQSNSGMGPVPPNLAAHAGQDDNADNGVQVPFSEPDDEAINSGPPLQTGIQG